MVEAKLRVELTQISKVENPFYGKTTTKKVVEETFYHDRDERDNIAPFGIMATIAMLFPWNTRDNAYCDKLPYQSYGLSLLGYNQPNQFYHH